MTGMAHLTFGQNQPNPFKSIGKKNDVIDINNGKYEEIIAKYSLERIGSVVKRIQNSLLQNDRGHFATFS
jgi:hypothetical protein